MEVFVENMMDYKEIFIRINQIFLNKTHFSIIQNDEKRIYFYQRPKRGWETRREIGAETAFGGAGRGGDEK
jgi:hypothetical protein